MLTCGPLIIGEWFLSGGKISPKVSVLLPYRAVTSFRYNFKLDSSLLVPPDPQNLGLTCSSHPFSMCFTGLPFLKPCITCTSSSIKETPPIHVGPCMVLPWALLGGTWNFTLSQPLGQSGKGGGGGVIPQLTPAASYISITD